MTEAGVASLPVQPERGRVRLSSPAPIQNPDRRLDREIWGRPEVKFDQKGEPDF